MSLPRLAIDKRKALSCLRVKFSSVEERYRQRETLNDCLHLKTVIKDFVVLTFPIWAGNIKKLNLNF